MLKQLRKTIIKNLLTQFSRHTPQLKYIQDKLRERHINDIFMDHFAIIDLPGPQTGISYLSQLFSSLGYLVQGRDYLADKQNEFLWLTEHDSKGRPAKEVLPQVVVADFRLDDLPLEIKNIIVKYSKKAPPSPLTEIQKRVGRVYLNDSVAAKEIHDLVIAYLNKRDWPLPSKQAFCTVYEFNKLLAWVLIFGRRPNHFTLSIHLLDQFENLTTFHQFIEEKVKLKMNADGGVIKGNKAVGLEQGSTVGLSKTITLPGGDITLQSEFVEFIWRYPLKSIAKPVLWEDYYTYFIPQHADRVIESLY